MNALTEDGRKPRGLRGRGTANKDVTTRQRLFPALGAMALTLLLAGPLVWLAYRDSIDDARADTQADADEAIAGAIRYWRDNDEPAPKNVWQVNPDGDWFSAFGEVDTEPSIMTLAAPALETGTNTREYDFDGQWLAHAEKWAEEEVLLAVVWRGNQDATIRNAAWMWSLVLASITALAGLAAWMAAGRLAAPVRRARAVNRDFIADAAHELRTPLAIIQASAGHALSRNRSDDEYRESLSEILTATERAGVSVGELLEFARLEAGQAKPRLAPLRLDLMVEEVAASVRVDGTIIESIPGEAVVVEADYNLLRQVVDNITRNAAARADKVVLTTHLGPRMARIDIADDGPGFDPGIIDHVFERFRRGDRSGSVGLGMAIARTIVELHGGTCVAANNEDGGALVSVELPYKHD